MAHTDLLYPVFSIVRAVIPPPGTRYSTVPHHEEWHHLGDNLAWKIEKTSKFTTEVQDRGHSERNDSPEEGLEGMFFAWGTVLCMSS
jgi:hypothetical protein